MFWVLVAVLNDTYIFDPWNCQWYDGLVDGLKSRPFRSLISSDYIVYNIIIARVFHSDNYPSGKLLRLNKHGCPCIPSLIKVNNNIHVYIWTWDIGDIYGFLYWYVKVCYHQSKKGLPPNPIYSLGVYLTKGKKNKGIFFKKKKRKKWEMRQPSHQNFIAERSNMMPKTLLKNVTKQRGKKKTKHKLNRHEVAFLPFDKKIVVFFLFFSKSQEELENNVKKNLLFFFYPCPQPSHFC